MDVNFMHYLGTFQCSNGTSKQYIYDTKVCIVFARFVSKVAVADESVSLRVFAVIHVSTLAKCGWKRKH